MPWHTEYGNADCSDDEWAVVRDADGQVESCHGTRADAVSAMAALYANEPSPDALTASGEPPTGAMIAWLPSMADAERLAVPGGEPAGELHLTAVYLGDAAGFSPEAMAELIKAVHALAGQIETFSALPFGPSIFNPMAAEPCLVLIVGGDALAAAQAQLMADPALSAAAATDAHKPWIPHITLGYYDSTMAPGPLTVDLDIQKRTIAPVTFDRLRVAFAGMTTDIPLKVPPPPPPVDAPSEDMIAAGLIPGEGTPFRIPLLVREGVWSSSGRMFAPNVLTWATPPLSLKVQFADAPEHQGALIAGRIDRIERDPATGIPYAEGVMDDAGEVGAEALRLGKLGMLNGVSVLTSDIDGADVELVWPGDGEMDEDGMPAVDGLPRDEPVIDDAMPAEGKEFHLPGKHNQKSHGNAGTGWPKYYDVAASKARQKRQRAERKAGRSSSAEGEAFADEAFDAEALMQPREIYHAGRIRSATIVAEPDFEDARIEYPEQAPESSVMVASGALQADGSYQITIPKLWPEAWFDEPAPEEMPPFGAIHITASGRITGWLAPPGVTHRAFRSMGRNVYVPMNIDYSEFNNKAALVASADGKPVRINAGTLTFDCGHANPYDARRADPAWASQHYENSCSVAARVRIGPHSSNGVPFVAGALLHGIDADTVERMMGCALSGDWQGGKLKAALFVPSEGFPAAVAASVRVQDDQMVASAVPLTFIPAARDEMESLARSVGLDAASQFRRLQESVKGADQ